MEKKKQAKKENFETTIRTILQQIRANTPKINGKINNFSRKIHNIKKEQNRKFTSSIWSAYLFPCIWLNFIFSTWMRHFLYYALLNPLLVCLTVPLLCFSNNCVYLTPLYTNYFGVCFSPNTAAFSSSTGDYVETLKEANFSAVSCGLLFAHCTPQPLAFTNLCIVWV